MTAGRTGEESSLATSYTVGKDTRKDGTFLGGGVVIVALWSAAEVGQVVNGWFLPLCVGLGIFGLTSFLVFRNINQVSAVLQGLGCSALAGIGLFRLVLLNTNSDADHLGGFICGLGCFGLEWAMLTKMKNEMRQKARDDRFRSR